MALKANDFIEVEYTGRLKDTGELFDTTSAEEAKTAGINNPHAHYGAVIICLGHGQLLKGIEVQLLGKELGTYTIQVSPEDAFGKKNAALLKIVPTNVFFKQGIRPVVGLQVSIDGAVGTVRTITGGRTIVDFNHPLSGKEIEYSITVKRIVTDRKEQLTGLLDLEGHVHHAAITITGNKVEITTQELIPEPFMHHLAARIKETMYLDAVFEVKKENAPVTETMTEKNSN